MKQIEILRLIAKMNPECVPLSEHRNPGFIEARNGQYALIVVKIDRQ